MPQAAEYQIGNTTVRVFDDACKSQDEVEKILRRISRLVSHASTRPIGETQGEATGYPMHRRSDSLPSSTA